MLRIGGDEDIILPTVNWLSDLTGPYGCTAGESSPSACTDPGADPDLIDGERDRLNSGMFGMSLKPCSPGGRRPPGSPPDVSDEIV